MSKNKKKNSNSNTKPAFKSVNRLIDESIECGSGLITSAQAPHVRLYARLVYDEVMERYVLVREVLESDNGYISSITFSKAEMKEKLSIPEDFWFKSYRVANRVLQAKISYGIEYIPKIHLYAFRPRALGMADSIIRRQKESEEKWAELVTEDARWAEMQGYDEEVKDELTLSGNDPDRWKISKQKLRSKKLLTGK